MISIIVPVYNTVQYLQDCLSSIQNQTVSDWECILVDDGSKDESGIICDHWAANDSRFKVIHQQNQGVSAARNNGIKAAKGEYVCFIDSDDWVDARFLQNLFDHTENAEIVVSGLVREYQDQAKSAMMPAATKFFALEAASIQDFVDLNRKFLLYAPHEKLYRRDLIEKYNISFPVDCSFGEDLQFNYAYLDHVKTIAQIAECDYHYRIIGSGTLSSKLRPNQFMQDYEQWQLLRDFYVRHNLWLEPAKELLYTRLWGIVYDGIFIYPRLEKAGLSYLKRVLSIPEIKDFPTYSFSCAKWIRWAIIHRKAWIFYIFFTHKK